MVNLFLHGMLGRKFGKEWRGLEVKSAAEALHAVDVNYNGGFRAYLGMNPQKQYKIKIGKRFIEEEVEVTGPSGEQDIHIMPVIKGRNSGVGKILAAVAIVALMWWNPGGWVASAALLGGTTTWGTIAAFTAASLVLGGVAQLLTPKVGYNASRGDETSPNSFTFGGNVETVRQGNPMPVAYGRVMINPLPISVSLVHEDYTAGGIATTPEVDSETNTNFNIDADVPPNNPVGQLVTVTSAGSPQYLETFINMVAAKPLPSNRVPPKQ